MNSKLIIEMKYQIMFIAGISISVLSSSKQRRNLFETSVDRSEPSRTTDAACHAIIVF